MKLSKKFKERTMKKKLSLIVSSVALFLIMLVTLCACSTYGSVKRKFEKEGWKENKDLIELQDALLTKALGEDYEKTCTIHALKKDDDSLLSVLNYVIILEFNSTKEMDEKIQDSDTLKGMIKDAQNSDYVSGTCVLLFYTPLGGGDAVFKSTK